MSHEDEGERMILVWHIFKFTCEPLSAKNSNNEKKILAFSWHAIAHVLLPTQVVAVVAFSSRDDRTFDQSRNFGAFED